MVQFDHRRSPTLWIGLNVWLVFVVGACHLALGIEEKPFEPSGTTGQGGTTTSSATGGSSSSSNSGGGTTSSSSSAMGGMASSSMMSSGTGGMTSSSGMGGMGGMGGMATASSSTGPSTDTCATCSGKDSMNVLCMQQGNSTNGVGFRHYDPKCELDPNHDISCFNSNSLPNINLGNGCRACRLCYPSAGANCDICKNPVDQCINGNNGGQPIGLFPGDGYCPPCVCTSLGIAANFCQGNYDHCL